jgi:hypothetical protein
VSGTQVATEVGTVRFGRLERRGVLLGLSGPQLGLLAAAVFVVIVAVRGAGGLGLAVAAPLWVLLACAALVRVNGRSVPSWAPIVAAWTGARATGRTRAASSQGASGIEGLRLPGVAGQLDVVACPRLGGVLVLDRRAGTVTAMARVHGPDFLMAEDSAREHRAAAWGRVLAGLCQQPSVVRIQVITSITPGGLYGARRWWRDHCIAERSGPAAVLADLLDVGFPDLARREHLVAFAARGPRGRKALTADAIDAAASVFESLVASLDGAGLDLEAWLDGDCLASAMRRAYDPFAAGLAEGVPQRVLGPVGVAEEWELLRTGTAWHATYWVAEWPRTAVDPTFLQPLLLGDIGSRTVTIVAEPVSARQALREIRRARAEHQADSAERQRIGQVEDRTTRAEVEDLDRREAEIVAGHGDLRFTGLVTVSAPDRAGLQDACRSVENDAARSMCDLIRLVGQQGAAHLAATIPVARTVR